MTALPFLPAPLRPRTREYREQQIRDGIRRGHVTLRALAKRMDCSHTLVWLCAKRMADVTITKQTRRTAVGRRTRLVLSLGGVAVREAA